MKIRKLHLKNIGVFDDEEIEFKECDFNKGKEIKDRKAEIHILTGENGTGKTTILQALASTFDSIDRIKSSPLMNEFHKRIRFTPYSSGRFTTLLTEKNINYKIEICGDTKTKLANIPSNGKLFGYGKWVNSFQRDEEMDSKGLKFAVFAFSGYRQVKSEDVEAIKEPIKFNPLFQSLEFVKNYSNFNQLTINQLIANNISKNAIEKGRNDEKAKRFEIVIKSIENAIFEITDLKVEFDLETEPTRLITKINNQELDFDVLPDGLRSLISWIADLLGRVDLLKWQDDLPITEKNLILLLDEIEVHLHPAWQRKVLPVVQKLFKNAQIFVSTHSPFVVNSVDDAWVYKLKLDENGKAKVEEVVESENSDTITQVLREVFGIEQLFGLEVQNNFEEFKKLKNKIISNGADKSTEEKLLEKARSLADEPNDQLKQLVRKELQELSEIKKKPYKL
ncbi:MAG: AAA family ATPase [Pyrinomonadaceae bacterium]|nr:AAA family ATPase [Pyrinomonadaceae bacterium]